MSDVQLYIMQFPSNVQHRLHEIRQIGLSVFSNAEEKIYHRVPTFMIQGKDILNYGAYKDHITLYPGCNMTDFLKRIYPQYHYTKCAMQLPHADPFPSELVHEICELLAYGMR